MHSLSYSDLFLILCFQLHRCVPIDTYISFHPLLNLYFPPCCKSLSYGQPPFYGDDETSLFNAIRHGTPIFPSSLSSGAAHFLRGVCGENESFFQARARAHLSIYLSIYACLFIREQENVNAYLSHFFLCTSSSHSC